MRAEMDLDWILDVLTDLRQFSVQHGLHVLADELDDVRRLAATEIATRMAEPQMGAHNGAGPIRNGSEV